jgi:tetratricopeptide (TPR) repeat protein
VPDSPQVNGKKLRGVDERLPSETTESSVMCLRLRNLCKTSITLLVCLIALTNSPMASTNATTRFASGDAALSQGRYEDARREFSRIITAPSEPSAKFEAFLRMGLSFPAEDEVPKARAQFEQALKVEGISGEQIARVEVKIGETHVKEMNYDVANALLEKVLGSDAASLESKIEARLLIGKIFSNYGSVAAWTKVRDACAGVIAVESAPEKARIAAHSAIVPALISLREFRKARLSLEFLSEHSGIPIGERFDFQIELARTLWLERLLPQTRSELTKAASMVAEAKFSGNRLHAAEAEIQLLLGLTFYDEKDFERAKIELTKVLSLPGQNPTQKHWREAYLRLRLRNLIASNEKELKVFFIGSSHTLLGNVPLLVEQLASSAPAGTPRIISGDHARMGTGMRAFWSQGDAPDTPRGKIAAEPWDVVVVETFYRTSREDLAEFGDAYAALARSHGSRLVIYESPASKSLPYPDGFSQFHASNIWLGKRLGSAVAPSVHAWLKFFGVSPTEERFKELYRDGIHATAKGAYLTACCLYAALTGLNPEGLWHPSEIRPEDALVLQQSAWLAFSETQQAILHTVIAP